MENKLPPFPWYFKSMKVVGEESTRIMDRSGFYVVHQKGIRPLEQRDNIASAIVSAVNNTWGAGINPEAIPEILRYLEAISNAAGNMPDESLITRTGPNDAAGRGQILCLMRALAKKAIEESKLPTP